MNAGVKIRHNECNQHENEWRLKKWIDSQVVMISADCNRMNIHRFTFAIDYLVGSSCALSHSSFVSLFIRLLFVGNGRRAVLN